MDNWKITKVTSIDVEAIKIIKEILKQNTLILELLCNPTIAVEDKKND